MTGFVQHPLVLTAWLADHLADPNLRVQPAQRLITYCGVGISASHGLSSLCLAGYRNLALCVGSWEEWGTDPNRAVEVEDHPRDEEKK